MTVAVRIHEAVAKVSPNLVSVSVGVEGQRSTWQLQFNDIASAEEKSLAQAVMNAFDPYAPEVPKSVTRLQARLALNAAGLFNQVSAAVSAMPNTSNARLYWDNASMWDRNNPVLIQMASELGLDSELDALFLSAAQF